MGRPIAEMDRQELAAALKAAMSLLQSVPTASFLRSDVVIRETPIGIAVGRTFKWAFIPAGQLWSEEDRREIQSRLDKFAARHGLQVRPRDLDPTGSRSRCLAGYRSNIALQNWLDIERETLDVSQVP